MIHLSLNPWLHSDWVNQPLDLKQKFYHMENHLLELGFALMVLKSRSLDENSCSLEEEMECKLSWLNLGLDEAASWFLKFIWRSWKPGPSSMQIWGFVLTHFGMDELHWLPIILLLEHHVEFQMLTWSTRHWLHWFFELAYRWRLKDLRQLPISEQIRFEGCWPRARSRQNDNKLSDNIFSHVGCLVSRTGPWQCVWVLQLALDRGW